MSNRMSKVKNYNQVLLALAGTMAIIFMLIAGSLILQDLWREFYRTNDDSNQGILAREETDQLLQDTLRKQIISFDRIQVLDSSTQTYILPVTQANLVNAEIAGDVAGLMNSKMVGRSYRKHYGNIYNNLILHNASTNVSDIIFKERISIQDFIIHQENRNKYVVIPGCSQDSNQDRFLNSDDLQELFIYDVRKKKLNRIKSEEHYTTLRVYQPHRSNELIGHFGVDRNKDGKFDASKEPKVFYKVDLNNMVLRNFVNRDQIQELQKLLEGR